MSIMNKDQCKDPVLGLVYQYMLPGDKIGKIGLVDVAKVKYKAVHKYPLHLYHLPLKKGAFHHLYMNNDDEYH